LPFAQFEHEPPQSVSVSEPFFTPSPQPGVAHAPLEQSADVQSPPVRHDLPLAHAGHVPPPQLTSVSAPFLALSVHVGA